MIDFLKLAAGYIVVTDVEVELCYLMLRIIPLCGERSLNLCGAHQVV